MNRVILSLLVIFAITSCNNKKTVVDIKIKDASEKEFVLTMLNINRIISIDTLKSDASGEIRYKMEPRVSSPQFYYLLYKDNVIASFILSQGENIKINADTLGNFVIDGSDENTIYTTREKVFSKSLTSFDSLSTLYLNASNSGDLKRIDELNREMGSFYVKYKRDAIRYVITNSKSIAVIPELYRRFRNDIPVFGEQSDVLIFRRVYDSLQTVYPTSPYTTYLAQNIAEREAAIQLDNRLSGAQEVGFPDVVLPDINNKMQRLSDLNGDVIILSFWTATNAEQKLINADLKEVYDKFASKGLKIYQISLDIDKPVWAAAVRDQKLPWVSVCDGLGTSSPSVRLYNITKLPALYIIDRNGDIVKERDIFDDKELEKVISKLLR